MSKLWDAEIEFEQYEAAVIIEMQFPELAPVTLKPFGAGWDNWAYLVNDTYVVRFPRREIAVPWVQNEIHWLPRLAPLLPLPIPIPELIGEPEGPYPWDFAGYKMLEGTTACRATWDAGKRMAAAKPLGAFLRALHDVHPETDGEPVPQDTIARTDLSMRADQTAERLKTLGDSMPEAARIQEQMAALATTDAHAGARCWVHGDLYPRHILVDAQSLPCGVIDWGDVHVGDPALDLMLGYLLFDEPARAVFFDTYGTVDHSARDRARFRALYYSVALMMYGVDINDEALKRVARDACTFALV